MKVKQNWIWIQFENYVSEKTLATLSFPTWTHDNLVVDYMLTKCQSSSCWQHGLGVSQHMCWLLWHSVSIVVDCGIKTVVVGLSSIAGLAGSSQQESWSREAMIAATAGRILAAFTGLSATTYRPQVYRQTSFWSFFFRNQKRAFLGEKINSF